MITRHLTEFPFIAILRGIRPDEAVAAGRALKAAGFRAIEVPLNSPDPFTSIRLLADDLGETCTIGAGTVHSPKAVDAVAEAGGRLIVMPHTDTAVIRRAAELSMACTPGVGTVSEAFTALDAGATGLKLFPAEMIPPKAVTAMGAVLPKETLLIPVGGIAPDTWQPYHAAGARAFGTGSSLYKAGMGIDELTRRARAFAESLAPLKGA